MSEIRMSQDQFDKKNNDGKGREITQDRRNASANMGKRQEPASLSFDFDRKPAEPDGLSFDFDRRPDAAADKVSKEAPAAKAPAPETPKKQYGLPDDYSRTR